MIFEDFRYFLGSQAPEVASAVPSTAGLLVAPAAGWVSHSRPLRPADGAGGGRGRCPVSLNDSGTFPVTLGGLQSWKSRISGNPANVYTLILLKKNKTISLEMGSPSLTIVGCSASKSRKLLLLPPILSARSMNMSRICFKGEGSGALL